MFYEFYELILISQRLVSVVEFTNIRTYPHKTNKLRSRVQLHRELGNYIFKVRKKTKVRNRYNQVPHLPQDKLKSSCSSQILDEMKKVNKQCLLDTPAQ